MSTRTWNASSMPLAAPVLQASGVLERVVDDSFLMTLSNTYAVGTGVVVLGTVVVFWLLRRRSHRDPPEELTPASAPGSGLRD